MEQFEFNFEAPKQPEEMTDEELEIAYKTKMGFSPRFGTTRKQQELAVLNPDGERQRLHEIDKEEDADELQRTYRR